MSSIKAAPRIFFIRHGETDWNRLGRLQGATETGLNARGRRQGEAAALHLEGLAATLLAGTRPGEIPFHISPMQRARETAEIIAARLGVEPAAFRADTRLREVGFGRWEGRTWPEIRQSDAAAARTRDRDRWGFQPPGGESYAMASERVGEWLAGLQGDACVIAHGGIARVLMVLLAGRAPAEVVRAEIWQGKVLLLGARRAEWWPEAGHG